MLKKIIVAALAILLLGGSTVAFAWWDKLSVNRAQADVITIGKGLELQVATAVINPAEAGNLIPASAVLKEGDTYAVELSYTVKLDATILEQLNLAVTVNNIKVAEVANPYGLIKVVVSNPGVIENEDVIVKLTVTIDESELSAAPSNAEAYEALANKAISFDVTFAATRQA